MPGHFDSGHGVVAANLEWQPERVRRGAGSRQNHGSHQCQRESFHPIELRRVQPIGNQRQRTFTPVGATRGKLRGREFLRGLVELPAMGRQ